MPESHDIFQALNEQDASTMEMVVARMEARAQDPRFVKMRGDYLYLVELASARTFLDLGCGTGLDARAAVKRPEFKGTAMGVDVSKAMIEAGEKLVQAGGLGDRVLLRVADAEDTGLPSGSFDVVVMHTLVSHVVEPAAVLREAARLLSSPRGRLLVFDADFASLAFAYPDPAVAKAMEEALLASMVANARIMRTLPSLAPHCGLEVIDSQSHILTDVGTTTFFPGFIDNYGPFVTKFGLQPQGVVDSWMAEQHRAMDEGRFFGSLNYHSYLLRRRA